MRILCSYVRRLGNLVALTLAGILLGFPISQHVEAEIATAPKQEGRLWQALVSEAKSLTLPTRFLEQIPPEFVTFEFEDLRAFAAEYHPKDHRMVLDRSLSLNAAGGTLRPLGRLTHKELETLYHELFHAYMDYLEQGNGNSVGDTPLMAFAREQQQCRYQHVFITPVLQKKDLKEERYLSETESWEALNETWAVFIGWAVWTQLEVGSKQGDALRRSSSPPNFAGWLKRLKRADQDAALKGYYEPEDPSEKLMARKRYLAPEFRLSVPELTVLMREVLGSQPESILEARRVINPTSPVSGSPKTCGAPLSH